MATDVFKIQGIEKTYPRILEFIKAGAKQYRIKKKQLCGYAYSPGEGTEKIGYFTKDPYSEDVLFIGQPYYDANGDRSVMASYRISKNGAIKRK